MTGDTEPSATTGSEPAGVDLQRLEQTIKLKELRVREREAERASKLETAPWWHRADPLVIAVIGGVIALTVSGI